MQRYHVDQTMEEPQNGQGRKQIYLQQINTVRVKPLKNLAEIGGLPPKGIKLFPEPYPNIFLCAKKKSGKTSCIGTILKNCADRDTKVMVFCPTVDKDNAWRNIRQWCERNGISFSSFHNIKDGKLDFLKMFNKRLSDIAEEKKIEEEEEEEAYRQEVSKMKGARSLYRDAGNFFSDEESNEGSSSESDLSDDNDSEEEDFGIGKVDRANIAKLNKSIFSQSQRPTLRPRKPYITPSFVLIFDDISGELKLPSVAEFLKSNRHNKAMCICSSQWPNDLKPETIKQMDNLLIFHSMSDDKLEKFRKDADLTIPFETLKQLYDSATKEPFNFLYIDTKNESFRRNFDKQYIVRQ